MIKDYSELPDCARAVIDSLNYQFDYAVDYGSHYTLCTESGYRYEVVSKE